MTEAARTASVAQWFWRSLTRPAEASFGRVEAVLLALYAAVVAVVAAHHEPWFDEAQGWLIAKDNGLWEILRYRLHHEGAPGLWQAALYPFAHVGLSFAVLHWVAAVFGLAGAFAVLRFAPLPPLLRWSLPFSFWLQYQFAVVARPYVMFPVLAFLAAHLFGLRQRRHMAFAVVVGLAANINLHAAAWACGVMLVYVWTSWKRREDERGGGARLVASCVVFCCFAALSAAVAWPATNNTGVLPRFTAASYTGPAATGAASNVEAPVHAAVSGVTPADTRSSLYCSGVVSSVVCGVPAVRAFGRFAVGAVGADLFAVANSAVLAASFLLLMVLWLWSRRSLKLLLPLLLINVVFVSVWVFDHHAGLAWIACLSAMWMALANSTQRPRGRWLEPALFAVLGVVVALQIGWSASAAIHDVREPYDAGAAVAKFLDDNYAGKRVMAFTTSSVPLQMYGNTNRFTGWKTRYWPYTSGEDPDVLTAEMTTMQPDAVVVGRSTAGARFMMNYFRPVLPAGSEYGDADAFLRVGRWTLLRTFCGEHFTHGGVSLRTCYEVYHPAVR